MGGAGDRVFRYTGSWCEEAGDEVMLSLPGWRGDDDSAHRQPRQCAQIGSQFIS